MAELDFELVPQTVKVTKRTVSDDNMRIVIDFQTKKLQISMPLKIHYSDGTVEMQRKTLLMREDDFEVAITKLFESGTAWTKPRAAFSAGIINVLKTHKNKLV